MILEALNEANGRAREIRLGPGQLPDPPPQGSRCGRWAASGSQAALGAPGEAAAQAGFGMLALGALEGFSHGLLDKQSIDYLGQIMEVPQADISSAYRIVYGGALCDNQATRDHSGGKAQA
jgi:hypothetical protein